MTSIFKEWFKLHRQLMCIVLQNITCLSNVYKTSVDYQNIMLISVMSSWLFLPLFFLQTGVLWCFPLTRVFTFCNIQFQWSMILWLIFELLEIWKQYSFLAHLPNRRSYGVKKKINSLKFHSDRLVIDIALSQCHLLSTCQIPATGLNNFMHYVI